MHLQRRLYELLALTLISGSASNADLLPDSVLMGISAPSNFPPEYPS
jgi:hypothetical protein